MEHIVVRGALIATLLVLGTVACGSSDDGAAPTPVVPTTNLPEDPIDPESPTTPAISTMSWTLRDGCNDGTTLVARFHELESATSNIRTGWTWPGGDQTYELSSQQQTFDLTCTAPGRRICFGAGVPTSSLYWGVSLNGDQACTDCCGVCGSENVTLDPINLVCPP